MFLLPSPVLKTCFPVSCLDQKISFSRWVWNKVASHVIQTRLSPMSATMGLKQNLWRQALRALKLS